MKYVIIANGPFLTEDIIAEAVKVSDRIVVLDGALGQLASLGIKPDIIIGDFDSIGYEQKKIWGIPEAFSLEKTIFSHLIKIIQISIRHCNLFYGIKMVLMML